jgi:hypothetical protein
MGNLSARAPGAAVRQRVASLQLQSPLQKPMPVAAPPPPVAVANTASPEQEAAKQRTNNLLARDRGRLGTVLSSLRGVLTEQPKLNQGRKILLGE